MPQPQSFKNHTRFFAPFHFVLVPILLANLIFSIIYTVRHWPMHYRLSLWWIVMSVAFILTAFNSRIMALKAQDRTIRLEEQLRLADLLPESQLDLIEKLTIRQFIALRFASDGEAAALAARAVKESLTEKQIKQAIVNWKADEYRV